MTLPKPPSGKHPPCPHCACEGEDICHGPEPDRGYWINTCYHCGAQYRKELDRNGNAARPLTRQEIVAMRSDPNAATLKEWHDEAISKMFG